VNANATVNQSVAQRNVARAKRMNASARTGKRRQLSLSQT